MTSDDGAVFLSTLQAGRRERRLAFAVLLVSGLIFLERTGAPYLTKPFDLREVRQLVHRMLTETGGASDHH